MDGEHWLGLCRAHHHVVGELPEAVYVQGCKSHPRALWQVLHLPCSSPHQTHRSLQQLPLCSRECLRSSMRCLTPSVTLHRMSHAQSIRARICYMPLS